MTQRGRAHVRVLEMVGDAARAQKKKKKAPTLGGGSKLGKPQTLGKLANEEVKTVLEGSYCLEDGSPVWQGQWGFSSSDLLKGQTSCFCYKLEQVEYRGHFMMKLSPPTPPQRVEETFTLEFEPHQTEQHVYDMKGTGRNIFGEFDLWGTLKGKCLQHDSYRHAKQLQ